MGNKKNKTQCKMIAISILCCLIGFVLNLGKKYDSQKSYAESNNSIWPGFKWWMGKNAWAIIANTLAITLYFLIFWLLLKEGVLKNPTKIKSFGVVGLEFEFEFSTVFKIFLLITSFAVGYSGTEILLSWLGKSSPIIKAGISEFTPDTPKQLPGVKPKSKP